MERAEELAKKKYPYTEGLEMLQPFEQKAFIVGYNAAKQDNWIPYTGDNLDRYEKRWLTIQETVTHEGQIKQLPPEVVFGHIDSHERSRIVILQPGRMEWVILPDQYKVLAFQEQPEPYEPK